MRWKISVLLTITMLCLALMLAYNSAINAQATAPVLLDSPLPSSTPLPILPSREVAVALQYVAKLEGVATDELVVGGEEPKTFPLLSRSYILVTIIHE